MLRDISFPKSNEYRTGSENEPIFFFLEAFNNSIQFDLLLGYFSSSALNVLSLGFANFLYRGGTMRLITNHILSPKDKEAIIEGTQKTEQDYSFTIKDYEAIKNSLDEYGKHFFNCLAWLIASKRIEIKIVRPISNKGISHYKSGVFRDEKSKVKFKASCNFTAFGLLENLEELDIKKSWESENNIAAIEDYESYFERIFYNKADFIKHLPFEEIEEAIITDFGNKDIEELLFDESRLAKKKKELTNNNKLKEILNKLIINREEQENIPSFPYEKPRDYQVEAYENWIANGYKGIFAMATGTGKTLTSLNCILNEYKKIKNYRSLILVPTIELVHQWKEEISKFKFKNIVSVSSANKNWRNDLRRIITLSKNDPEYSFFIITTYRSFSGFRFQSALQNFPLDTIFIADEAHNCGASSVVKLLDTVPLDKRIGLSATPERIYDLQGTTSMEKFFNDSRPYTYEFSMKEALDKNFLCKYYYYPFLVELTPEELKAYVEISNKLGKLFNSKNEEVNVAAEKLLLLRKQIIHKANNKLDQFDQLISELSEKGKLQHTLVYAPEGYFGEFFKESESLENLNVEENRICEFYSSRIRTLSPLTKVALFNAGTENRGFMLNQFSDSQIDILVSMKCLDEGVDVPRTENAIFCASTGNPRQFIQRRGRVLRKHKDKDFSHIYDLVVVPSISKRVGNIHIERKLIQNELKRINEFASLALNKFEALEKVQDVLNMYNISQTY